jgi:uracil-DNA glycosylase
MTADPCRGNRSAGDQLSFSCWAVVPDRRVESRACVGERSMTAIQDFQRRLYANYKGDLSLPPTYKYIYGNPVQPVVPLDTAQGGVFIIGAYPSAQFATIGSERDVPVGDNCGPFSTERYFDGSRVRTVASGKELEKAYLAPLGLHRAQCWITDLVRVFLFKEGHLAKYRRLGCSWPEQETRSQFEGFAQQGSHWLGEELALAQPLLVITLGAEVAGILRDVRGQRKRNALLGGDLKELQLGTASYPAIHLAHPGIVMRPASERNPWPRLHWETHIPAAREAVEQLAVAGESSSG